jgi:tRNA threonylcarbamoyladenosine biosynthesis protein TsaB
MPVDLLRSSAELSLATGSRLLAFRQKSGKLFEMADWVIAIETVATAGSVALFQSSELRAERVLPPESRSARTMAAAVRDLWHGANRPAISLVAVASGPGSFTGLRVGITTAKALAYAWGAKLVGVSTLDAIAAGLGARSQGPEFRSQKSGTLQVVLEAQRKELFVGVYQYSAGSWNRTAEDRIVGVDKWLQTLKPETLICGPPLQKLRDRLPEGVEVAPESTWYARATSVGRLALGEHQAGAADELWSLTPKYLRPSYAEEKGKIDS